MLPTLCSQAEARRDQALRSRLNPHFRLIVCVPGCMRVGVVVVGWWERERERAKLALGLLRLLLEVRSTPVAYS